MERCLGHKCYERIWLLFLGQSVANEIGDYDSGAPI